MTEETAKALIEAMDRLTKAIQEDHAPPNQYLLPLTPFPCVVRQDMPFPRLGSGTGKTPDWLVAT